MSKIMAIQTNKHTEFLEITSQINSLVAESDVRDGTCLLFVPHTTAGITINENADPDVKNDMLRAMDKLVPMADDYRHAEGNSAAHIKASLLGSSMQLIVQNGRLLLGTWQGIYFCEFDGPRQRKLVVKIQADK